MTAAGALFAIPGALAFWLELSALGLFGIPFVIFGLGLWAAGGLLVAGVTMRTATALFFASTYVTFVTIAALAAGVAFPSALVLLAGALGERAVTSPPLYVRMFFALLGLAVSAGLALIAVGVIMRPEVRPWSDNDGSRPMR
ncbi:MAG: hypothetical protein HYV63_33780 [Candidatus Schekmanbacteria bacterium]|nr:hypothetical protein [Candidatus Schekmanbacteria bacterium]